MSADRSPAVLRNQRLGREFKFKTGDHIAMTYMDLVTGDNPSIKLTITGLTDDGVQWYNANRQLCEIDYDQIQCIRRVITKKSAVTTI